MTNIVVMYFSGYGHTKNQAEAVHAGAASVDGCEVKIIAISKEGDIGDDDWAALEKADAIIFGSPTYMGAAAWQFKKIADASSKPWGKQLWKDKIAGGFTNSGTINGDKYNTINYMFTLAMQHSMIWVGTGLLPANKKASTRDDLNWLGGFTGAFAQSPADASAEEAPPQGDIDTAKSYGKRVAEITKKFKGK